MGIGGEQKVEWGQEERIRMRMWQMRLEKKNAEDGDIKKTKMKSHTMIILDREIIGQMYLSRM